MTEVRSLPRLPMPTPCQQDARNGVVSDHHRITGDQAIRTCGRDWSRRKLDGVATSEQRGQPSAPAPGLLVPRERAPLRTAATNVRPNPRPASRDHCAAQGEADRPRGKTIGLGNWTIAGLYAPMPSAIWARPRSTSAVGAPNHVTHSSGRPRRSGKAAAYADLIRPRVHHQHHPCPSRGSLV
jgi:hypothetical protein